MTEQQKIDLLDRVVERLDELNALPIVLIHKKYCFVSEYIQPFDDKIEPLNLKDITYRKGGFEFRFYTPPCDIIFKTMNGHVRSLYDINELFTLDPNTLK